jgi:hypothetical protein
MHLEDRISYARTPPTQMSGLTKPRNGTNLPTVFGIQHCPALLPPLAEKSLWSTRVLSCAQEGNTSISISCNFEQVFRLLQLLLGTWNA